MVCPTASLPPEHAAFGALLDAQPAPATTWSVDAFNYLLCLLRAKRGALRLADIHPCADSTTRRTLTDPIRLQPLD